MKINVVNEKLFKNPGDTRVFFLNEIPYQTEDKTIENMINYFYKTNDFTGKLSEIMYFTLAREETPNKVIMIGMGNSNQLDAERLRNIVGKAIKKAKKVKSNTVDFVLNNYDDINSLQNSIKIIAEAAILANYQFVKYKKEKVHSIKEINIIYKNDHSKSIDESYFEGSILAESNLIARDLVNEPANILYPTELAKRVETLGHSYGFEVVVYDEIEIESFSMPAYLSVAQGSSRPPRLIVMRYLNNQDNKEDIIGLVGKGLTYDSGGLSIKNSDSMLKSKYDMAGAAAVIGAMTAIAKAKLKINVIAVVAACESMISGISYKPGDIIDTMAGKTVYIENTDAEGRLTLVDAIHYIIEKEKARKILDIATLTGAVISALGTVATAVISNDNTFYDCLKLASDQSGEKIWRLPIFDEYRDTLKTDDADLTNRSGNPSTITAALFIEEFVQNKPWIHMDIAGTALSQNNDSYLSKGGTGVGVKTIYYLVKNLV